MPRDSVEVGHGPQCIGQVCQHVTIRIDDNDCRRSFKCVDKGLLVLRLAWQGGFDILRYLDP